jgi:hypothetical protein
MIFLLVVTGMLLERVYGEKDDFKSTVNEDFYENV